MTSMTAIRDLQTFLRKISQHNSNVISVVPDGIFGEQTKNSVMSFQRAYNLPVTGKVDYPTWIYITDVYFKIIESEEKPQAAELIPIYILPVGEGTSNVYVNLIQSMINVIASLDKGFNKVPINGVYDEATQNEIKKVQALSGLKENGIMDKATWKSFSEIYSILQ